MTGDVYKRQADGCGGADSGLLYPAGRVYRVVADRFFGRSHCVCGTGGDREKAKAEGSDYEAAVPLTGGCTRE